MSFISGSARASSQLQSHRVRLLAILLGTSVALLARVDERDMSGRVRLGTFALPHVCIVWRLTGRRCPGCGLTRGSVLMLHGDWQNAVRSNPLTPVILLAVWVAGMFSVVQLFAARPRAAIRKCRALNECTSDDDVTCSENVDSRRSARRRCCRSGKLDGCQH